MKKINLVFSVLVLALVVQTNVFAQGSGNKGYKPGDIATDFKLKNVDGKTVSLADYSKAKGTSLFSPATIVRMLWLTRIASLPSTKNMLRKDTL